tara:strand:- start:741 stop:1313 length:573 start_codon:yes stop_codon:yes gene_type:complete
MFTGDLETDSMILYTILEPLDYYIGTERKSNQFKDYSCSKGGGSVLYGYTWKGYLKKDKEGNNVYRKKSEYKGLYQTKFKTENPELENIFKEFMNLHAPFFKWRQCQVNVDYISPPHFDSANTGESMIIGIGDYTGGELNIDRKSFIEKIDIHNRIYKFNGAQWKHWASPIISGSRISVVFYNSKCLKNN